MGAKKASIWNHRSGTAMSKGHRDLDSKHRLFSASFGVSQLYMKRGSNNTIIGILSKVTVAILTAGSTASIYHFITPLKIKFSISKAILDGKTVFNGSKIYHLGNNDTFFSTRSYVS